ncbi:Collagen triple helix repeat-containing protein 1 [Lamellibrachia satsuma]|nr:Collagen triple helix repeat-containing protein 1 [Lamellibrachia satsuma]
MVDGQRTLPLDNDYFDNDFVQSWVVRVEEQFRQVTRQLSDVQAINEKLVTDIAKLHNEIRNLRKEAEPVKTSAVRMKQCSKRPWASSLTNGRLMTCRFVKERSDTVLRVVWSGHLNLKYEDSESYSCRRWFFTLNGEECLAPRSIDVALISPSYFHMSRANYVEGYCRGVAAGPVNITWNIGNCPTDEGNSGTVLTGGFETTRIVAEEVFVEDASDVIV